jgi:pimeloyl-ACP methyl ester carboxylesterase
MKKKTKHRLFGVLSVIVVGFAGLNLLAYNHAHAMMRFTTGGPRTSKPEKLTWGQKARVLLMGVNVPRPRSELQLSDLDPECRRLSIRCPGGVTLGAWYSDRGVETPLVVLFHGYGAEKTCLLPEAQAFLKLGTSVLLVDFRGSGESSEAYTTIGFREANDVSAVMRHVRDALPHSSVILYGQSMGGVAILRAVQQDGITPDGVIVEAVFDTMLNTVRHRFAAMGVPSFPSAELLVFWGGFQTGFNAFAHNPVVYAEALRCPALFMHGTDDPRARLEEGRRVFAAVPSDKQFKEFPSAGHESYLSRFPVAWKATVEGFLKRVENRTSNR